MKFPCVLTLLAGLCVLTDGAEAQATTWVGNRTYYGGPSGMASGEQIEFQPLEVTEIGIGIQPIHRGNVSIGISALYLSGGYGGAGETAVLGLRGTFDGYSVRVPIRYRVARPGGTGLLDLIGEIGAERAQIGESSFETRAVFGAGAQYDAPLWGVVGLSVGLHWSVLSSSMVKSEELPEEFTNHNHTWKTLRIGLTLR